MNATPTAEAEPAHEVPDELMPAPDLRVPAALPVRSLSPSSIETWIACREQWRRKYIEKIFDPTSLPMAAGTAVGNVLAQVFVSMRDGTMLTPAESDDLFLKEWDLAIADGVALQFGDDVPMKKENARKGVQAFFSEIVPSMEEHGIEVIEVEREVRFAFPGTSWHVKGYLDLLAKTDKAEPIFDVKWGKRQKKANLALRGIQPRLYMAGRFLETGSPEQQFQFITGKDELPQKGGNHWASVPAFTTPARQLYEGHMRVLQRVALVAREIARCYETGDWDYADPDTWRCTPKFCSAYDTCPGGGLGITEG